MKAMLFSVGMYTWVTSDQHYGHGRIIELCQRPFSSVEEMNEALIENHNRIVRPGDIVWHLGDFSFLRLEASRELLARLNGEHHLVLGNHDRSATKMREIGFLTVQRAKTLIVGERTFAMSHKPQDLPPYQDGVIRICGHVHEKWVQHEDILNVGVDVHHFSPFLLGVHCP